MMIDTLTINVSGVMHTLTKEMVLAKVFDSVYRARIARSDALDYVTMDTVVLGWVPVPGAFVVQYGSWGIHRERKMLPYYSDVVVVAAAPIDYDCSPKVAAKRLWDALVQKQYPVHVQRDNVHMDEEILRRFLTYLEDVKGMELGRSRDHVFSPVSVSAEELVLSFLGIDVARYAEEERRFEEANMQRGL